VARLLRMPKVAANATEVVLSRWPVSENTPFHAQDVIATVETEKALVDVPADADGVILKTLVQPGAVVEVGSPVALLGEPGELVQDLGALLAELGAVPADANSGRAFSSPLARRLAREAGLSIAGLRGTGPGGRVVRRDIQQAMNALPTLHLDPAMAGQAGARSVAAPAAVAAFFDIPHTRMRRDIAARLTESTREVPHFFVRGTARVDKLLRLRARLNHSGSVRVSVNDLVVTAAARAHVLVPAMNVIWLADAVRSFAGVDISVAVATDAGLVTPVLRGVDQMTLLTVAVASSELVGRARSGQLQQEELEGGTLTVTNLGGYGTEDFAAIINPPQSAILAVGAAHQEPVVTKGSLKIATVMIVTLSVDHRPIDAGVAARWMAALVSLLEEPVRILV